MSTIFFLLKMTLNSEISLQSNITQCMIYNIHNRDTDTFNQYP